MVVIDNEVNDQASEVMTDMPSPIFNNKPAQKKRKRPRNKDLEINPSLETAIPQHILQDVPGVKSKKNKKKKNKSNKKQPSAKKVPKKKLPIESIKDNFIEAVRQNQVVIVEGEPGSGKSTKLPQYLFKDILNSEKRIICTEPRRMAARNLASRVSQEMGTNMGKLVGYRVRFEDYSEPDTAITFVTEGILLRELESDPLLGKYAVVFLDDVHERSIHVDLLMALLKSTMARRADLKVIIASATLETGKFVQYYPGATVVSVPFETPFPVEIKYMEDEGDFEYVEAAVAKVFSIHQTTDSGDILIFLTGEEDIMACCDWLWARDENEELWVLPCYAALPLEDLSLVFDPTPPKYKRKVVVATNIAEVSITIDGIVFVIDAGYVKQRIYNSQAQLASLLSINITKVQAKQRAGRVGRTQRGVVYRLYSHRVYKKMKTNLKPEIQRTNLESTVMTLAAHKVKNFEDFDYMDPPKSEDIQKAITALHELGALDLATNELTPAGQKMARMPLEPRLAKALLTSVQLGCSEDMLSIVSIISAHSSGKRVFQNLSKTLADAPKSILEAGDHIALLEAYKIVSNKPRGWCYHNAVNFFAVQEVLSIRSQLAYVLRNFCDAPPPSKVKHAVDTEKIYKCILSGFFCNIACKAEPEKGLGAAYKRFPNKKKNDGVYIHPTSSLFRVSSPDWVIYEEVVKNKSVPYMRNVIPVKPEWMQELVPEFFSKFRLAFPPAPAT